MLEDYLGKACGQTAAANHTELNALLNKLDSEGSLYNSTPQPDTKKASKIDMAYEFYVNSLLSDPGTHGVNVVSNCVPLTSRVLETAMSSAVQSLSTPQGLQQFKEVAAEVEGLAKGSVDAIRFLKYRFLKRAASNEAALAQLNMPKELAKQAKIEWQHRAIKGANLNTSNQILVKGLDYLGTISNTPGEALTIGDTFFKIINYRAEISKQAMRKALSMSSDGAEINKHYTDFMNEALSGSDLDIIKKGLDDADIRTYTNRPAGKMDQAMAEKGHDIPGMRWVVPFRRTMVNIMSYGLSRTPLAAIPIKGYSNRTVAALQAGGAERAEAIGRMAAGTLVITGVGYTLSDRLDGQAPVNAQARDLWEKDGHKENTIRLADGHIPLDMLGPYGFFFKAQASYQQLASNIDHEMDADAQNTIDEMAADYVFALSDAMLDDHWVSGLSDVVDMLNSCRREDSIKPFKIYMTKIGSGFVPNVVKKRVTRNIDPNVKQINSPFEAFISKVPFWSKKVTNKIDLWGEPMTYDHFLDPSIASPITGKDPVASEMRKIGVKIPVTRANAFGVALSPQEYEAMMVYAGKGFGTLPPLRDKIAEMMQSPLYNAFAHDAGRAELIHGIILDYRAAARSALLEDPRFNLKQRIQIEQIKQRERMRQQ